MIRGNHEKGGPMPHYLHQVAYTSDSWKALIAQPQNRVDAVRHAIEKLGGDRKSVV